MNSLKNRIFLLFVVLLLLVQAIDLWTIFAGNKTQENQEITNRLKTAQTIVTEQFNSRSDYLTAFAETASRDYGIKQVFDDDTRSLLVALNNHRERIDADLAMTVSVDGIVTAQLQVEHLSDGKRKIRQGSERGSIFRFQNWFENQQKSHLYMLDNSLYQLSLSPLLVGQKVIGWVAFGFQLDHRLAKHLNTITQLNVDFILRDEKPLKANEGMPWRLISSSNPQANLSVAEDILNGKVPDKFIATSYMFNTDNNQSFGVAMYGLRADIVEVLQKQWWQFLILAVLTLLLSLISAYWIAASITKPIKRLVEQARIIAGGNYQHTVDMDDKSELGQLAREFNEMQNAVLTREDAIRHSANHDALSDLPNRNILKIALNDLIKQSQKFTIFHLNLSRLKDVNETLGHDVGDWLIKEAAERLGKVKGAELLCHIGTDEFIILSKACSQHTKNSLVTNIQEVLESNCEYKGVSLQLQMRIGISFYPEHSSTPKELLQMADMALHHTRKSNQTVQVYNKDLDVNSVERLNLINDLKNAIADQQLALYYQPKINLKTGEATHVEALVRWHHPRLGMIPPDDFIYIAEQTGQINALTQSVFLLALNQFNQWKSQGITLNIAVNISAENLKDSSFYRFICQSTETHKVPPNKITLEVTESVVVGDPDAAIALLQRFKDKGFKLSIDDYGTGYSSLAQLKQLPVHELKIDKSFVQKLQHDEDDQIIVRSTIELAHNMGLTLVAEGIEDEFALKWLASHGCELGQGYFISRPQPVDEITPWLLNKPIFDVANVPKSTVVV